MLISVCIPTYSRFGFLKEAVRSALNQSYGNIEICISQDPQENGPDLKIKEWCEEQALKYSFLKFNLNQENLGLAGNWNRLVEMVSGDYFIIIGDDDVLHPFFIQSLAEKIKYFNADVAFSNQYFIDKNGEVLNDHTNTVNKLYFRNELVSGMLSDPIEAVLKNSVPMSAALIKTATLKGISFSTNLNTPEFEVFFKIALRGGIFVYDERKLAYYRIHDQSATAGGLTIDELLINIMEISVPPKYQEQKFVFISTKIIPGTNRALRTGNRRNARKLLRSNYYPKNRRFIKVVQELLILLPQWFVRMLV